MIAKNELFFTLGTLVTLHAIDQVIDVAWTLRLASNLYCLHTTPHHVTRTGSFDACMYGVNLFNPSLLYDKIECRNLCMHASCHRFI